MLHAPLGCWDQNATCLIIIKGMMCIIIVMVILIFSECVRIHDSGGSRILERGVQVCGRSPHWRVSGPL